MDTSDPDAPQPMLLLSNHSPELVSRTLLGPEEGVMSLLLSLTSRSDLRFAELEVETSVELGSNN